MKYEIGEYLISKDIIEENFNVCHGEKLNTRQNLLDKVTSSDDDHFCINEVGEVCRDNRFSRTGWMYYTWKDFFSVSKETKGLKEYIINIYKKEVEEVDILIQERIEMEQKTIKKAEEEIGRLKKGIVSNYGKEKKVYAFLEKRLNWILKKIKEG